MEVPHNIEYLRVSGEKHFAALKPEGQRGVCTRDLQVWSFNQAPRPIWGLANQVSHV